MTERARKREGQRERMNGVQRPSLWRRGLGTAAESPTMQNRLNRCQSSRASNLYGASILVRHHYGDGGLRVVNVEGAASGNQFHKAGGAVVVADKWRRLRGGLPR